MGDNAKKRPLSDIFDEMDGLEEQVAVIRGKIKGCINEAVELGHSKGAIKLLRGDLKGNMEERISIRIEADRIAKDFAGWPGTPLGDWAIGRAKLQTNTRKRSTRLPEDNLNTAN